MSDVELKLKNLISKVDIAGKEKNLRELELVSTKPEFWQDWQNAQEVMKKISTLQKELAAIENLQSLAQKGDLNRLQTELEKQEHFFFLSGPFDSGDAILAIHAGQGGTEACDWAEMLYRMYNRYVEKKSGKRKRLIKPPEKKPV